MKIRKGDKVTVIAGKDRGKTGTVSMALPQREQVLIEGMNIKKKHVKSREKGKAGQIIEKPHPIHVSNVMLIDTKSGTRTRTRVSKEDTAHATGAKKDSKKV